ncbi:hypothetical protein [Halobellus clavatus]|jgi:hypothetical protein|uniref:Uncharacterized protein n=1 Tax=Halobellus clavatus TaxID=660517 RepID=A0A1H3GYC5_9EURY|nr:hypothetical protein [Halobellus clavatus]SDY08080.1 hypothetical protein SAMN04487946_10642 [Halobellus clavatus]
MTPLLSFAAALSVVNVVLLAVVSAVWARNYRTFRSPLTLGLLSFAAVLAVENLVALSFFFSMGMLYTGSAAAQQAVLAMRGLQFVAIVFLTIVSLR